MSKLVKYIFILIFLGSYFLLNILKYDTQSSKNFITFLNVGNGDSILIGSKGNYLLIDGGSSSYSLKNLYKYTKYTYPQSYIITHPHLDHLSAFTSMLNYKDTFYDIYIANNFKDSALINRYFYNVPTKSFKSLVSGDTLYIGDVKLYVLWPKSNCDNKDPNYCSLILEVFYKNTAVALLLADAPYEVQQNILQQVSDYVIIKVPHQGAGSGLNKSLVLKASPKHAIFSVGKNSYGHPSKNVLEYYKNSGIKIKRTDELGDITFYFD